MKPSPETPAAVPGVLPEPRPAHAPPHPPAATTAKSATWVLVADAKGARIFSLHDPDGGWTLHQDVNPEGEDHSEETAEGLDKNATDESSSWTNWPVRPVPVAPIVPAGKTWRNCSPPDVTS